MKKSLFLFASLILTLFLSSCGEKDATTDAGTDSVTGDSGKTEVTSKKETVNENIAVSTWENHSLTEEAGGKWKASIAFGENLTLLGETADAKDKTWEKVELEDGKTGWVRQDLIAKGGKLGAITETASLYKRPGVSNITDEKMEPGELVVILEKKDQWTSVIGVNDASYHRKKGWLLGDGLVTDDEIDVAVGVMITKAMAEKNPIKRREKLNDILANTGWSQSPFYKKAELLAAEADPLENLKEDELMITGTVVNVRSSAEINDENKLFKVESGNVCKVLEKGAMDEINGNTDYWYKIGYEGQEGWIFGSNTSRALDQ